MGSLGRGQKLAGAGRGPGTVWNGPSEGPVSSEKRGTSPLRRGLVDGLAQVLGLWMRSGQAESVQVRSREKGALRRRGVTRPEAG